MKRSKGMFEKRTLEIIDNYSEELERVIQNPELLSEEEHDDREKNASHTIDNAGYRVTHAHHSSNSQQPSSHSHNNINNSRSHNSSSHQKNAGTGRLASHHRSRRHHHRSEKTTGSQSAVSEGKGMHLVPSDVNFEKYDDFIMEKDSLQDNSEFQNRDYFTADTGTETAEKRVSQITKNTSSQNSTKRIASKASGTESSKRKAERETEASNDKENCQRKKQSSHKKKIGFFGVFLRILMVFLVISIASVGFLVYLRVHGENSLKKPVGEVQIVIPRDDSEIPEIEEVEDDGKTITYKGEKYRYNDNVSTILFMGTDRTNEQQETTETAIGINGQADTIILCVIDNTNKKISFINVNRDTMTPVSEYTPDGDYAGDKVMQICLAYSYGADNIQSSERMVEAVSKYLYGMPINAYCRMSYDGIPTLNDAVGGVTVTVPEDMTAINSEWIAGSTIILQGAETTSYIRWRNRDTVHTNELRMSRQKQYLKAFMKQTIEQVRADLTLPLTLYSIATDYMTTDITASQVTYLSSRVLEYGVNDDAIFSVPGESVDGEEHVEFYTDDKGLYEIILNTFYNKIG